MRLGSGWRPLSFRRTTRPPRRWGRSGWGRARGVDDLIMITLGTGIGGGIISGGKVLRGFSGMAGELGHITAVPYGNPCGCGNSGCVEKHASATAIIGMARMLGLGDSISAKDVFDMAVAGNERGAEGVHFDGRGAWNCARDDGECV